MHFIPYRKSQANNVQEDGSLFYMNPEVGTILRHFTVRRLAGLFPSLCRQERCVNHFVVLYSVSEQHYASAHCSLPFRLVSLLYFRLTLLCKFILKLAIRQQFC